ncbi:MAG: DUF3500 domain-containing protein [Gemmataceae bacterium]
MKRLRSLLVALVAVGFCSFALIGRPDGGTGAKMADAAKGFLATLNAEQKQKASFAFDDKKRLAWFFTPQQNKERNYTRIGVRFEEMSAEQKAAALALLKTGTSKSGYEQATTIMSLEGILKDLEGDKGAMVRNTGWYFVSVFGEPSNTGSWGWRFEGHHMSLNYTLDKGEVVTATPMMFGANPAEVKAGERKGLRTLPAVEDEARALIKSLNEEQVKVAKQPTPEGYEKQWEIKENNPRADVGDAVGITADKLTAEQRGTLLMKLLNTRTACRRSRGDRDEAGEGHRPGEDVLRLHRLAVPGKPYTYRVSAPEFVVETLNVQADSENAANHIHSAWRRLPADFGLSSDIDRLRVGVRRPSYARLRGRPDSQRQRD